MWGILAHFGILVNWHIGRGREEHTHLFVAPARSITVVIATAVVPLFVNPFLEDAAMKHKRTSFESRDGDFGDWVWGRV